MSHPIRFVARLVRITFVLLLLTTMVPFGRAIAQESAERDGWGSSTLSDDLVVWVQDGSGITAEDFAVAYESELSTALEELLLFLNVPRRQPARPN